MNTFSKNIGAAIIGFTSIASSSTALANDSGESSLDDNISVSKNPNFSPELVHEFKQETQTIVSTLMKDVDPNSEEYKRVEELVKLKEAIIIAYLKSSSQIDGINKVAYHQLSEQERGQRREEISLYGGCFDYLKEVHTSSYDTILEICATHSYELLKGGDSHSIINDEGKGDSSSMLTEAGKSYLETMMKTAIQGNPEFTKILMEHIKLADEGSENERHKEIYKIFEVFLESLGLGNGEINTIDFIPTFLVESLVRSRINELIKSGEEVNQNWRYEFMMDYGNDVLGKIAQEKRERVK